jgi:hypothetical protein
VKQALYHNFRALTHCSHNVGSQIQVAIILPFWRKWCDALDAQFR